MPHQRSRLTRATVPLLLLLLLAACSAAGRPGAAGASDPAGAGLGAPPLAVPTWPADPATQIPAASGQQAGSAPAASGQPNGGATSSGGPTAGGSAVGDPTVLSLSGQADRALQELDAALSADAAAPTDEGGLP